MKVCALMVGGLEANFSGNIELGRFMTALSYIDAQLSIEEVWLLAEITNLGSKEEDEQQKKQKYIHLQPYLRAIRRAIPELNLLF